MNTLENVRQNANAYKELCENADKMSKKDKKGEYVSGWEVIDNDKNRKSNFKGVLYGKDGQYALCFVGTDKWSYKDHGANLKMAATGNSEQIKKAKEFAQKMQEQYGLTPANTVSIGHSEGGTEVTHVGLNNGYQTVTFNAYGAYEKSLPQNSNYNLVINFRDPHDPVSKLHNNVGQTYITPTTQSGFLSKTPFGSVKAHGIVNMGDCNEAMPVEDYKKTHPMFLNKISDVEISRKDIGEMDSSLFNVYEKEIDKRLAKNDIKNGKWITINGNHVLIK